MKKFLLALALLFVGLSLASAEDKKTLLQQAEEIGRTVDRLIGTQPAEAVVTITKKDVTIASSDLDQAKDAVTKLSPDDAKKPIRIVAKPVKPRIENGHPVVYVSFGKPLIDEYVSALGDITARSPNMIVAKEKNRLDPRPLLPLAEKELGIAPERSKTMTPTQRILRVTWMEAFAHKKESITVEFE